MAAVQTFKVHYHGEIGGKRASVDQVVYVQAADGNFNTIQAVLSSNSVLPKNGSLQITSVQNVGPVVGNVLA